MKIISVQEGSNELYKHEEKYGKHNHSDYNSESMNDEGTIQRVFCKIHSFEYFVNVKGNSWDA